MGYAIKENGTFRAVTIDMELLEGEEYFEDVPQWAYDKMEAEQALADKKAAEDSWRVREVAFITDQLIGIEDGDPSALPGTEAEWRAYRTEVRAWKDGHSEFPDDQHRPIRPS
ncbi:MULTISPECIES: hypothetical protein [unclassified Pseudomonas]|uniref:hypothetical protein n=1 Tax=unclassified Pseudomonas TaxID=196821 RepID=UPI00249B1748|nr:MULTISPECIES: hypothetical protein [unclassified Pseudomonas]